MMELEVLEDNDENVRKNISMLYVLAILCPPLAVGIVGNSGKKALVNLLFTLCFWVPGVIHAFFAINEAKNKYDEMHRYTEKSRDELSYSLPHFTR